MSKISFHIFDTADEYQHLGRFFNGDELDIVDPNKTRMSVFQNPENISHRDWVLGSVPRICRESFFWRERTVQLYREVCLELLNSHSEITPRLFLDSYTKIIPKGKQRLSEFGSLERFATILKMVPTFHCKRGERIETISKKSRIYRLKEYPEDARLFLVSLLTKLHVMSRQYEKDRPLDLILVFDELSQFFTKETLGRYVDITESFYLELLRTDRKMGIGVILADQTYSMIHEVTRSNCQTKIILDTRDGVSRREIARDLGLDREQENFLAALSYNQKQRRAVVQLHDYPFPILVKIPNFKIPQSLSDEEMKIRLQKTIDSMEWTPIGEEKKEEEYKGYKGLEDKHFRVLKTVACNPLFSQQEYADNLSMSRATFSKYSDYLEEVGLLRKEIVNTYRRGGTVNVLIPTGKAYEFLKESHIKYSPIQGNGSSSHTFWQYRIWRRFKDKKNCYGGIEYSLKPDGKRVDVGLCFPNRKIAYEVVIEDLKKELKNLHKDLAESWDVVVFCVENEEVRKKLDDIFFDVMTADIENRVEIRLLKEFY
ncbi:hypothetical protein MYX82_04015 [Acidobacteria bacterium AH-259-D05]|nr:hypothetical protein [Acidobacteria bacterium AH-259-D05]